MSHPLVPRTLENAAPLVDAMAGALELFPGVGTAVGLLKIKDDFKSHVMQMKIKAFMDGLHNHSQEEIDAMAANLQNEQTNVLVNEALLFSLDSYSATLKCKVLGTLFLAYLKGHVLPTDLRRMAQAIDHAFPDDLQMMIFGRGWRASGLYDQHLPHLVGAGLAKFRPAVALPDGRAEAGGYELTELATKLIAAMDAVTPA